MGVDINTYRCRVGQFGQHHGANDMSRQFVPHHGADDLSRQFVPHHGAGDMSISNMSLLTSLVGAIFFIRMILVMAGIEQNPGPHDTFLFRYQYLLIDIGAKVLREIFEVQVGRDFVNYLTTNNAASGTLTYLMTGKNRKITPDQEKLLPPMEKNPKSSAYDITLLSLLLRNICGLCPAGDPVWMNPLPTDHRVEADITRLRKCRNEMMHIDTLHISEKDLKVKWQELEQILHRLNNTAGLANVSKMINDTKHMDIDFELRERYLHTIKAWAVMDCAMDELDTRVGAVESAQKDTTRQHSELDTRVLAVETAQQDTSRQHSELDTRVGAVETTQQDTSRQHSELDTRLGAVETTQQDTRRQHSELDIRVGAVETTQQDTSRQHSELDTRVGAVETTQQDTMRQHSELDTRVGAVETTQQDTSRQQSELDTRVVAMETAEQDTTRQQSELDTRVGAVETTQQDTSRQQSELDTRVGAVETTQQDTMRQHSELDTRVGAVETAQQDTMRQHSELDTRVGAVETTQQDTSRQQSELDTRVGAVETTQQDTMRQHSELNTRVGAVETTQQDTMRQQSELDTRVVAVETTQQDTTRQQSELDTRVGAVETTQQDTTRKQSELDTRVEAVETTQQDTTRKQSELDTRVEAVETTQQDTTRQQSELDTRVGAVETTQQDTSRQQSELDTRVEAVETTQQDTSRQQSELDTRVGAVETTQQDTSRQQSELDTRVGAVETTQQDTSRQQSELDTRVGAVETTQQDTTRQHSELDTRVGAVETTQQDTSRQQSELDTRVGAVETTQQDTSRQQSELDTRVGAVETTQQDTTRQHSKLDTRVGAVETTQQDTTRKQSELDTRVGAVETTQQDTTRQYSELDTRVEAVATAQQDITRQHAVDISVIKRDHSELDTRVVTLEKMQQPSRQNHSVAFKDIQNQLIGIYKRRCMTLPVSPVFTNRDDNLLNIYKYPTMYSVQRNRAESDKKKKIKSYEGMFCKDGQVCEEIYLTGDAGVGKTAFCTCMSLLWCYVKSGTQSDGGYPSLQKDMEYLSKFDFLFYVSLRDTCHINVVDMIIEQLFRNNKDRYQSIIENILSEKSTLILMDGLDEWTPSQLASKRSCKLPDRIYSNNCVYITTSRPHRLESVRLSSKDVDHHIEIMGLSGDSSKSYVEHVVKYLNEENSKDENVSSFIKDVKQCNLSDLLCIPIIASHLVVLWFEGTISNMPRALIYANILEMLFKRADQRGVGFISSTEPKFQHIPAFVSGMNYLNKHLSLLYNVCHLSFRLLFQSDEKVPNLVFTVDQLVDEPYCFTVTEIDFLCHIGVLSKNEVFGCYSVEKLKLTFIHKSYLDFFAALYISSCDTSDLFDDRWKSINYVLQSENMILLLVGMSNDGGKQLFDTLYQLLSDELSLCRTNVIFYHDHSEMFSYRRQIESLQDLVIKCSRELDISRHPNIVLRLEDYSFCASSNSIFRLIWSYNDDVLIPYLVYNASNVKSIHSPDGNYYVEFDKITNLQCLHVGDVTGTDRVYDVKFSELMIQNHSTLYTVCIEGSFSLVLPELPALPELPVRSLHHLTSLSLSHVRMKHAHFHDLLSYISDNILMENIKLDEVSCDDHKYSIDCIYTLNLSHLTKLVTLYLIGKNIECKNINTSSMKSFTTDMVNIDLLHCIQHSNLEHLQIHTYGSELKYSLSDYTSTVRTLTAVVKTLPCKNIHTSSIKSFTTDMIHIELLHCIRHSKLEHLQIYGYSLSDNTSALRTLTAVVKTLPCIRLLQLSDINLPQDTLLELHPAVTTVKIKLTGVKMSRQWFHCFIQSCVNKKSVIQVELYKCKIISDDGEPYRELSFKEFNESLKESVDYMYQHLTSIQTVNITQKYHYNLDFETRCQ